MASVPSPDHLALVGLVGSGGNLVSGTPFLGAVVDSGATASCTDSLLRLSNVRPRNEVLGDAGGLLAHAKHVGDLPAFARTSDGQYVSVRFKNVRHVAEYKFTLLSSLNHSALERAAIRRAVRRHSVPRPD